MALTLAFAEGLLIFLAACARFLAVPRALTPSEAGLVGVQALVLTLCGLLAFHFSDLYDLRRMRRLRPFVARLPQALLMMVLLVGATNVLVPGLALGWRPVAETVALVVGLVVALRATLAYLFAVHPFSRRVLVLGTTELAGKLVREMVAEPDLRDVVVGVVDDGSAAFKPTLPSLRLGPLENLGQIIEGFEPNLIVCALPERHDPVLLRELLTPRALGVPVEDGVEVYERLTGKVAIEAATPRAVLISRDAGASRITLACARALSFAVAACAVVVLAPLFVPVALLIKLDSRGPVFFLHERVGLGGRPFRLIKLRTMRPGGATSEWASDNEHRTTRLGRLLRRFRIDELPQFLNVLRGDMNLVGPRPHPVSNVELFTQNIPYYGVRCSVRPGLTGWAQIRYGYANNLAEETEKMRYDLHYIKQMSLGLDLRILFETAKVVLTGSKSATLVDEPRAWARPIYFGIEPPGSPSGATRRVGPARPRETPGRALALVGPVAVAGAADGVVPLEGRRSLRSRAPSRGAA